MPFDWVTVAPSTSSTGRLPNGVLGLRRGQSAPSTRSSSNGIPASESARRAGSPRPPWKSKYVSLSFGMDESLPVIGETVVRQLGSQNLPVTYGRAGLCNAPYRGAALRECHEVAQLAGQAVRGQDRFERIYLL